MDNWYLKYILLVVIVFFLSGCGMFGKVLKSDEYAKQEIGLSDKKKMKEWTVDRSTLTIREKSDTVIVTPENIIKEDIYWSIDSLVNGLTVIQDDLLDVSLIFHPKTGMFSASANLKSRSVPVKFYKETIWQNDVHTEAEGSSTVKKSSIMKQSHSSVEKGTGSSWYFIFGMGILILISFSLLYWLKKRYLQRWYP